MSFVLGKKVKMSQVWKGDAVLPVTIIHVPENEVFLVRTKEKDGHEAAQVGFLKHRRETKFLKDAKAGTKFSVEEFKEGDLVRISGIAKGRGFQGVVKRHGFHGGPKTHGQKNRHRAPGSIGVGGVQKVSKGRRMAGRMGGNMVTVKSTTVVEVDEKKKNILIHGAVPGMRGTIVQILKIGKSKEPQK